MINSVLTLPHASAIHKIASSILIDFENSVIGWKLPEIGTIEVNRRFCTVF